MTQIDPASDAPPPSGARRLTAGDYCLDLEDERLWKAGAPVRLGGKAFVLLRVLMGSPQTLVTKDELFERVWAGVTVSESVLTTAMKELRQALGDDARQPRYIRTVRSRGYQLGAPPEPLTETARRRRTLWPAVAAVGILAATSVGVGFLAREQKPMAGAQREVLDRARWYAAMGQRDNNERALDLYDRALREAPDDVEALSGASRARSARRCLYNAGPAEARDALRLATRAVAVRPDSATAWSALGYARDCLGDIPGAIAGYERAVRLDPTDDASRASAAYLYQEQGRLADALHANLDMRGDPSRVRFRDVQLAREYELLGFDSVAETRYKRLFDLAPDNVFGNIGWPAFLFAHGRFEEARGALAQARARGTSRAELAQLDGELALRRGDRTAAANAFAEARALRPDASLPATLAVLHGVAPVDPAWLTQRIAATRASLAGDPWPASRLELALLLHAAGDRRGATAALADAVDKGWRDAGYLRASPLFSPLAGDPGFEAVLDTIARHVAADRDRVLQASWRPADLGVDHR